MLCFFYFKVFFCGSSYSFSYCLTTFSIWLFVYSSLSIVKALHFYIIVLFNIIIWYSMFFCFISMVPPCSLAVTMTSAEGSKKFHYNIPAPLHSTCWFNTFEGSKWSEVGSYSFFIFLMYTFKRGLAHSRFYKFLDGQVHV